MFTTASKLSLNAIRHDAGNGGATGPAPGPAGGVPSSQEAVWQRLVESLPKFMTEEMGTTAPRLAAAVVLLLAELKGWIRSNVTLLASAIHLLSQATVLALKTLPSPTTGTGATAASPGASVGQVTDATFFLATTSAVKDMCTACSRSLLAGAAAPAPEREQRCALLFKLLWTCGATFGTLPVAAHLARGGASVLQAAGSAAPSHRGAPGTLHGWAHLLEGLLAAASTLATVYGGKPIAAGGGASPTGKQVMETLLKPVVVACGAEGPDSAASVVGGLTALAAMLRGADVVVDDASDGARRQGVVDAGELAVAAWPTVLRAVQACGADATVADRFCLVRSCCVMLSRTTRALSRHCYGFHLVLVCAPQLVSAIVLHLNSSVAALIPDAANQLRQVFAAHRCVCVLRASVSGLA